MLGLSIINLGRIDTCTILNIPIHENGMCLFIQVSFYALEEKFKYFSTKAKCIFVSVISGHFIF